MLSKREKNMLLVFSAAVRVFIERESEKECGKLLAKKPSRRKRKNLFVSNLRFFSFYILPRRT